VNSWTLLPTKLRCKRYFALGTIKGTCATHFGDNHPLFVGGYRFFYPRNSGQYAKGFAVPYSLCRQNRASGHVPRTRIFMEAYAAIFPSKNKLGTSGGHRCSMRGIWWIAGVAAIQAKP